MGWRSTSQVSWTRLRRFAVGSSFGPSAASRRAACSDVSPRIALSTSIDKWGPDRRSSWPGLQHGAELWRQLVQRLVHLCGRQVVQCGGGGRGGRFADVVRCNGGFVGEP